MKLFNKNQSTIVINGRVYNGNNITVKNNKVFIDGKDTSDTLGENIKTIDIVVNGDINIIDCDVVNNISVNGSAYNVKTTSGDVKITGGVEGSVQTTSGDIEIDGDVNHHVNTTSGDVKINGNVSGDVKTISGDINN